MEHKMTINPICRLIFPFVLLPLLCCSPQKDDSASPIAGDCSGTSMQWECLDPLPNSNNMAEVTYGNGTFVTVADGGTVFFSADCATWQRIQLCTYHNMHSVTFAANTFVAVGDSGTLHVSPDGRKWHSVQSGTTSNLETITFGSGKFVAAGDRGTICYSENAETWKISSNFKGPEIRYIASGAGVFIAAAYPDHLYKSVDAINWQEIALQESSQNERCFYGLAYINNRFFATGYIGSESAVVLTSVDGTTWERKDAGIPYDIVKSCLFADNRYYAFTLGLNRKTRSIYTSADLSSWSVLSDSAPAFTQWMFAQGTFVGVGGSSTVLTSPDAKQWTTRLSAASRFKMSRFCGVAYGAATFALCDVNGTVSTSPDGISWVQKTATIGFKPKALLYRAGRFIALGENREVSLSPDALVWNQAETMSSAAFIPGVSAQGVCVAVGQLGMAITRKSDSAWVQCKTASEKLLTGIAFGAGRFVAVGENGTIVSSPDGFRWSLENSGTRDDLRTIVYAAGHFIAVGYYGCILASQDGKLWHREISGTTRFLYWVAFGAGRYVVAGQAILSAKVAHADTINSNDPFIGLWLSDDMSEGYAGFLHPDSASFISEQISITPQESFAMPAIPENGATKESFIPSGWELLQEAEGDLNGDNVPDIAMGIQYTAGHIVTGDNGPVNAHPRILLVLFKDKNRYHRAAQNDSLIIERTDPSLEEPFQGLEITNRVLTVQFSFFYSTGTWEMSAHSFKFRFQAGSFALIGKDYSSFWRNGANPNEDNSCNYMTGKKRTIIETPNDNGSTAETTWTQIEKTTQTLESMGNPFTSPGE
jgi:hypothetical protein